MGRIGRLLAFFAALAALAFAAPAVAESIRSSCHAFSLDGVTFDDLAARPGRWNCGSTHWKDSKPVGWLRFDAKDWRKLGAPSLLVTRITKFDRLDIVAIDRDGTRRMLEMVPADVTPVAGRSVFSTPLPKITPETDSMVVRIERPWNAAVLSDAALSDGTNGGGWPLPVLVALGMVVGLLFAPLIFDLVLYSVLRQRFVLWHGALVLAMLAYVVSFSGLIVVFAKLDIVTLAKLNGLAPAAAAALAGYFTAAFLEPGVLSGNMRQALRASGLFALLLSGAITVHPPFLDYTSHQFYFLGFVPPLFVQLAAMAQAYRRRSRAVKFLIAAWAPIMLCGAERIVRGMGAYAAPPLVDELLYFALVVEVVVSAMGVADRLMSLRHQRDMAQTQARVLASLAEHDPLTGLLNRRAIEPRFAELCEAGFCTFALIDLDQFKSVNDEHGHNVGDEVLRAVAEGLAPDEDTLVMRLGGEEFLLLLRGEDTKDRAEQRRQTLPRWIANRVPGLDRLVTASMGLVEGPPETMARSGFRDVYSRADKLLYEAKETGRNRTVGEKITLFDAHPGDRRGTDRRKGDRRQTA